MSPPTLADELREWARGSLPLTAAVELLIRSFGGRFAARNRPWIRIGPSGAAWLDDSALAAGLGALSGGERRVLTVVAALADSTGSRRIDLADVITGVDRDSLDVILAALAHAAGTQVDTRLEFENESGIPQLVPLPSLHPWPGQVSGFGAVAQRRPPGGGRVSTSGDSAESRP